MINIPLGNIVASKGVASMLETDLSFGPAVGGFLTRHQRGDWGDVSAEDKALNDEAAAPMSCQGVHSSYTHNGTVVWIMTNGGRSTTTVLLPEEY